jgi:hypothetical protein
MRAGYLAERRTPVKLHWAAKDLASALKDQTKGKVEITEAMATRVLRTFASSGCHVVGPHRGKSLIFSTGLWPGVTKEDLRENFEDLLLDLRIKDKPDPVKYDHRYY